MPLKPFEYLPGAIVPSVVLKSPVIFRFHDLMEIDSTSFENLESIKAALETCPIIRCAWIRNPTLEDNRYSLALNLKSQYNLKDFTEQINFWLSENF